jgi:hypothetical protein
MIVFVTASTALVDWPILSTTGVTSAYRSYLLTIIFKRTKLQTKGPKKSNKNII